MNFDSTSKDHYSLLRKKYGVSKKSLDNSYLLYVILRKAELGIQPSDFELKWLSEHSLFTTKQIISHQISLHNYQSSDAERLESNYADLRNRYLVPETAQLPLSSFVYAVLYLLESGVAPASSDIEAIESCGLSETGNLIRKISRFLSLKQEFCAAGYPGNWPEKPLSTILNKLKHNQQLSDSESLWLSTNGLQKTLKISQEQEKERKIQLEFESLKKKYKVQYYKDKSVESPLYSILKALEEGINLQEKDLGWIKEQSLVQLLEIEEKRQKEILFQKLQSHYKVIPFKEWSASEQLFFVLIRVAYSDSSVLIPEILTLSDSIKTDVTAEDVEWLDEQDYRQAAQFARQVHFRILKSKYRIVGQLSLNPFYEIMVKLERSQRLDPKQVVQLIEEHQLAPDGKIAVAHYKLEAEFYQSEYQRTGNKWELASASSNWRKANQPHQALEATNIIQWDKVKDLKLKSALSVTRGAAFRDVGNLDQAEALAKQSMECQPDSHQPYTLLGAICYGKGLYTEGDRYFAMAEARGASNTDDEIQKVVKTTRDKQKRQEVAEYLLQKNPSRYAWANVYIK